jgi:pullulanase
VIDQVHFLNTGPAQTPGLIVMQLEGNGRHAKDLVVLFNGSNQTISFEHAELNAGHYSLHPVQRWSIDRSTRQAYYSNQQFHIPAMTTSVFIAHRGHHSKKR